MNYEFPRQNPLERNSKLLDIVERAKELEKEENLTPEEISSRSVELVAELLSHLRDDLNLELSNDVTSIYQEMATKDLLARVEDIGRVLECVTADKPIVLGASGKHTANTVMANAEGLRVAMAEAGTTGPVRLLIGLDVKTLIGFKGEHLEVHEVRKDEEDFRDTGIRNAYLRHVSGEIHAEDIKYMVMRIPKKLMPSEEILPEEASSRGQFVFRGARLEQGLVDVRQAA